MKKRIRKKDFTFISGKKYDGMTGRCYRPKDPNYKYYGERGIKVAEAWIVDINEFRSWLKWELQRLNISEDYFVKNSDKLQLDRINVHGHYTPENCRIVSPLVNGRNKTNRIKRVIISAEGKEVLV